MLRWANSRADGERTRVSSAQKSLRRRGGHGFGRVQLWSVGAPCIKCRPPIWSLRTRRRVALAWSLDVLTATDPIDTSEHPIAKHRASAFVTTTRSSSPVRSSMRSGVPLPPAPDETLPMPSALLHTRPRGSAGAIIPGIRPSPRSGSRTPRHKQTSSWTSSISSTITPSSPFTTRRGKTGSSPRTDWIYCTDTPCHRWARARPAVSRRCPPPSTWVSCTPSS